MTIPYHHTSPFLTNWRLRLFCRQHLYPPFCRAQHEARQFFLLQPVCQSVAAPIRATQHSFL